MTFSRNGRRLRCGLEKYPDDPWLYTVLIAVPEVPEGIFVKMKLIWCDGDPEDDAGACLVSVHRGLS